MKKYIPASVKKLIGNSNLFWKYRHKLTGDGVWHGYASDWIAPRRGYYSEFCAQHGVTSVLDFGCASGNNLHRIEHDCADTSFSLMGIDVSDRALDIARDLVVSDSEFHTKLSKDNFERWLQKVGKPKVDLVIFDRVLVVLSEQEIRDILCILAGKTGYMIIDDFSSSETVSNGVWETKDYVSLLADFSFEIVHTDDSMHKKTDDFQITYAKRLVLKSIQ